MGIQNEDVFDNLIDLVGRVAGQQSHVESLRMMDQDGFRRMAESSGLLPDSQDLRRMLERKLEALKREEVELEERIGVYHTMQDLGIVPMSAELDMKHLPPEITNLPQVQNALAQERLRLLKLRRETLERKVVAPVKGTGAAARGRPRKGAR